MSGEPPGVLYAAVAGEFDGRVVEALTRRTPTIEVTHVETVSEGLDRLPEVDCVVCGRSLSDADALEFFERVRECDPSVPLVVYTDRGSEAFAAEAVDAGVTGYVPATDDDAPEQLARRVEQSVAERQSDPFLAVLDALPDGAIVVDADLQVRQVNAAVLEAAGLDREELVGRPLSATLEAYAPESTAAVTSAVESLTDRAAPDGGVAERSVPAGLQWVDDRWRVGPLSVSGDLFLILDRGSEFRTERFERLEEFLAAVHSTDSVERLHDLTVTAATVVVDVPVARLWRRSPHRQVLEPVAGPGAASPVEPGDVVWDTFEDGEFVVHEEDGRQRAFVPLDEYGLLEVETPPGGRLSQADRTRLRLLGLAVEAALDRLEARHSKHRHNERLQAFTRDLAHRLRAPVASAKAWLELATETDQEELLADVDRTLDHVNDLISELPSVAPRDGPVTDPESVPLGSVTREVWNSLEPAAQLVVEDPGTVEGDPDRIELLFEHLFENAIEHGDVDHVRVGETDRGFFVADDGSGVDETRREDAFEYGYTTDDDRLGFGLAVVADVARAHGWTVTLTESDDGGARFHFEIDRAGRKHVVRPTASDDQR